MLLVLHPGTTGSIMVIGQWFVRMYNFVYCCCLPPNHIDVGRNPFIARENLKDSCWKSSLPVPHVEVEQLGVGKSLLVTSAVTSGRDTLI